MSKPRLSAKAKNGPQPFASTPPNPQWWRYDLAFCILLGLRRVRLHHGDSNMSRITLDECKDAFARGFFTTRNRDHMAAEFGFEYTAPVVVWIKTEDAESIVT